MHTDFLSAMQRLRSSLDDSTSSSTSQARGRSWDRNQYQSDQTQETQATVEETAGTFEEVQEEVEPEWDSWSLTKPPPREDA